MADNWKFGDVIENRASSEDNPTRRGYFVRVGNRSGKVNPGRYAEMTDGHGQFWKTWLGGQNLVRIAHTSIEPLA